MKLHEIAPAFPQFFKTKEWLDKHGIKNYTIRPNGVVDVDGDVNLNKFKGKILPVQFGRVEGIFDCSDTNLTSFKGAPRIVGKVLNYNTSNVASLEGIPPWVGGNFGCFLRNVKSLSGIDKMVKHVGGGFYTYGTTTHILGLLLIDGITEFGFEVGGRVELHKIMNKYVGTGDILSAQDELIDAGFTDQARL
jgi:hypothetical protein